MPKKITESNQDTENVDKETVEDEDDSKKTTKIGCFFLKEWAVIIFILILSLIVHLPNIGNPNMVVFDEVHFGGFLTDYINGVCFFDIHPPLAKMILAGTAKLAGYKGDFNFSMIESRYPDDIYIKIRLCPAILCSFVPPLLTATLILQHCSLTMTALCGLLFTFEFNQISQSRLIVTDGILYFFVALSIFTTALEERYQQYPIFLIFQAFAATCAFCTKFTAAGCFILIALSHIKILFIHNRKPNWFSVLFIRGVIVSVIFLSFLYVIIVIHLKLMPNKGYGDLYMQSDFRELPMPVRVYKLLLAMYSYNANLKFDHPYKSKWYQWPFCLYSPLFVSVIQRRYIFLFSNPVSSSLSLLGFIIGFFTRDFTCICYSLIYFISYAPFILVDRCVFNYHYEIPLMFGILALCLSLSRLLIRYRKVEFGIAFVITAALLGAFAFWFPWIYGTPISHERMRQITIWPEMRRAFRL